MLQQLCQSNNSLYPFKILQILVCDIIKAMLEFWNIFIAASLSLYNLLIVWQNSCFGPN